MLGGQHMGAMDGAGEYHDAVRGKGAFVQENLHHVTFRSEP